MKDMILEKLSRIQGLEERKLLKDMINNVFLNVIDYNQEMFEKLSKDIFEEIEYNENRYTIYTTAAYRQDVDPVDEFLYPMLPEDMKETEYDTKEILQQMKEEQPIYLFKLFLECDYLMMQEILGQEYEGRIITEKSSIPIKVSLTQSKEYKACIQLLYENFLRNGIVWTTINAPYIEKFVDVTMISWEREIEAAEKIVKIEIDLGKYDKYKKEDMVPLWNIEELVLPTISFPIPAMDHVNFQHELSLAKSGTEHGYLVLLKDDFKGYVKRNQDTITVCAPVEEIADWHLLKVANYKNTRLASNVYELMSNQTINSFTNRYARQQPHVIRTKAEIIRVITSFEVSKYLDLAEFKIIDQRSSERESYSMDFFLTDEIREENYKKILVLEFTASKVEFITRDIMSFLVSEIQQYFPEYVCEGSLAIVKEDLSIKNQSFLQNE